MFTIIPGINSEVFSFTSDKIQNSGLLFLGAQVVEVDAGHFVGGLGGIDEQNDKLLCDNSEG